MASLAGIVAVVGGFMAAAIYCRKSEEEIFEDESDDESDVEEGLAKKQTV